MRTAEPLFDVPTITSLQDMILRTARLYPGKLAIEDLANTPMQRFTYSELLRDIRRFGAALHGIGLRERSHIAVLSENRAQWALAYLTAQCFNYVAVPVDRNLSENEILNIIHESDAEAIVFSDTFEHMLRDRASGLKKLKHYISMDLPAERDGFHSMTQLIAPETGSGEDALPPVDPEATAAIVFTSGSLGRAKGVELTQRNLVSNLMGMVSMIMIHPEDRFLSVLPTHHTYECTCGLLCPMYMGSSVHYARSLKTIVDDIQRVKATIMLGVPLLYDKMFRRINKSIKEQRVKSVIVPPLVRITNALEKIGWKGAKRRIFSEMHERFGGSVRIFIAGGAAPDPLVAKGLREFGFTFIQGYGLTETSPILALNRLKQFKDDAAGLPLRNVEIAIHEPDADGIGEIWAKGPSVMKGYYKNDAATAANMENGWFKTGDLGFIDSDGFLHISGRKKNVIIGAGGKNVFPEEIEDLLLRSPFVLESYVYGEKDPKHQELIAAQIVVDAEAFIELSESRGVPITEEMMRKIIAEEVDKVNKQLKTYKQIRKFHLREQEFEKTTTQKIKRHLVKTPGERP